VIRAQIIGKDFKQIPDLNGDWVIYCTSERNDKELEQKLNQTGKTW
jgi:hypothetical protein